MPHVDKSMVHVSSSTMPEVETNVAFKPSMASPNVTVNGKDDELKEEPL